MAIKFEILAADPEIISLIQRYWAANELGEFIEKVSELLPFREITNSNALASFIRTHCKAFDENQTCSLCGELLSIANRSEAKKIPLHGAKPCEACKAVIDEDLRISEAKMEAELQERLAEHIAKIDVFTADYSAVPDDIALILIALERAIAPRLIGGRFAYGDCDMLAPMYVQEFIDRVWRAGLLRDDPRKARPGTYLLNKGNLAYYRDSISIFLVPDDFLGGGTEAFQTIVNRPFDDKQSLLKLWYDYAMADCMSYLYDQCHVYRLDVPQDKVEDIKSTIRTALQFYSVSQVWCLLWKVVKDASSLANHRFYNDEKAAATISGKLLRHYEQARKSNSDVKNWSRVDSLPAGMLGQVFTEYFGIDENTSGVTVSKMFSEYEPLNREEIEASIDVQVQRLMTSALANNLGAAVMFDFAELIRNGAEICEAIELVLEIYPVIRDAEVTKN